VLFIRSNGRLGNQLFIWATAILLGEITQKHAWIAVKSKSDVHPFVQQLIRNTNPKVGLTDNWLVFKTFVMIEKLFIKLPSSRFFLRMLPIFLEDSSKSINQEKLSKSRFIDGFFQRSWIVEQNSERICRELQIALNEYRINVSQVDSNVNAIHVRRGDYLNSPEHWGILSLDFYQQIVSKEEQMNCFTDMSEEEVTEDFNANNIHVYTSEQLTDIETFYCLSQAKKLVIANSSFSWWAGFLAASHGAKVYAPFPWFKSDDSWNKEIYPSSFIKIDSKFE
jgi:hypothetical protein